MWFSSKGGRAFDRVVHSLQNAARLQALGQAGVGGGGRRKPGGWGGVHAHEGLQEDGGALVHACCIVVLMAAGVGTATRLTCVLPSALLPHLRVRPRARVRPRRGDGCCSCTALALCRQHLDHAAVGGVFHILQRAVQHLHRHRVPDAAEAAARDGGGGDGYLSHATAKLPCSSIAHALQGPPSE
jgi:hypothetical protein